MGEVIFMKAWKISRDYERAVRANKAKAKLNGTIYNIPSKGA